MVVAADAHLTLLSLPVLLVIFLSCDVRLSP